jgi:hypothetical protein
MPAVSRVPARGCEEGAAITEGDRTPWPLRRRSAPIADSARALRLAPDGRFAAQIVRLWCACGRFLPLPGHGQRLQRPLELAC